MIDGGKSRGLHFLKMECMLTGIIQQKGELNGARERRISGMKFLSRDEETRSEHKREDWPQTQWIIRGKENKFIGTDAGGQQNNYLAYSRTVPGPGHILESILYWGGLHSVRMRFYSTVQGKLILFFPYFPPIKTSCGLCGFLTRLQHGHCMLMRQHLVQSQTLVSE